MTGEPDSRCRSAEGLGAEAETQVARCRFAVGAHAIAPRCRGGDGGHDRRRGRHPTIAATSRRWLSGDRYGPMSQLVESPSSVGESTSTMLGYRARRDAGSGPGRSRVRDTAVFRLRPTTRRRRRAPVRGRRLSSSRTDSVTRSNTAWMLSWTSRSSRIAATTRCAKTLAVGGNPTIGPTGRSTPSDGMKCAGAWPISVALAVARAVRDAARRGDDVSAAMFAGWLPVHRDQQEMFRVERKEPHDRRS